MNRFLIVAASLLALSACAGNKPYQCPLTGGQSCNNMQEVYDAARGAPRTARAENVVGLGQPTSTQRLSHSPSAHFEPGEHGQPVFRQPRVYRVWLAPYVDADGNLRSGEYTYFSTPGEWAYGTTREAGSASSATFGPQRPDQLGFTPVEDTPAPARRASDAPVPPSATTRDGITQPRQTLVP